MDFKALRKAELLGRGHHGLNDPENADQAPQPLRTPAFFCLVRLNQLIAVGHR